MNVSDLTIDEARDVLREAGYNAYGTRRLYGVVGKAPGNQATVAIKSEFHLDSHDFTRIYMITRDGTVPVRRA